MPPQAEPSKEFTAADRANMGIVAREVVDHMLDEFADSGELKDMYGPFQELLVRILMCGDTAFSHTVDTVGEGDAYGAIAASLASACKEMLASGRFDYYHDQD